jgi:large subunit ribosomal protein L9
MKVILTAEVKGKGHEGDVVEVARGYAVNYLLPRKMAVEATSGNVKQLDARMKNINKRNAARLSDAEAIATSIDGKSVVIEAKAGADGKLFGSVTALMIEEAIASQIGADVDHKRMNLHRPIKTAGAHEVAVSVFGEVKATVIVKVVPEGGAAAAAAEVAAPVVEDVEEPAESEDVADEAAKDVAEEDADASDDEADAE